MVMNDEKYQTVEETRKSPCSSTHPTRDRVTMDRVEKTKVDSLLLKNEKVHFIRQTTTTWVSV